MRRWDFALGVCLGVCWMYAVPRHVRNPTVQDVPSPPPLCHIGEDHMLVLQIFEVMKPWVNWTHGSTYARTIRTLPLHGAMMFYSARSALRQLPSLLRWSWNDTVAIWDTKVKDLSLTLLSHAFIATCTPLHISWAHHHHIRVDAMAHRWLTGNPDDAQWRATECIRDTHVFNNAWVSVEVLVWFGIGIVYLGELADRTRLFTLLVATSIVTAQSDLVQIGSGLRWPNLYALLFIPAMLLARDQGLGALMEAYACIMLFV